MHIHEITKFLEEAVQRHQMLYKYVHFVIMKKTK